LRLVFWWLLFLSTCTTFLLFYISLLLFHLFLRSWLRPVCLYILTRCIDLINDLSHLLDAGPQNLHAAWIELQSVDGGVLRQIELVGLREIEKPDCSVRFELGTAEIDLITTSSLSVFPVEAIFYFLDLSTEPFNRCILKVCRHTWLL
jgi:hypothetical protein